MSFSEIFTNFVRLLLIATPPSAIPLLLALTPGHTTKERIRTATVACCVAAGILAVFALTGNALFSFFGISMQAFKIAGGCYLISISIYLLFGDEAEPTDSDAAAPQAKKKDVAITPLGIPFICGPGMISATLLMGSDFVAFDQRIGLVISVILSMVAMFIILWIAAKNANRLNPFLLKIAGRLMGLYVCALGFLIFFNGLEMFFRLGSKM